MPTKVHKTTLLDPEEHTQQEDTADAQGFAVVEATSPQLPTPSPKGAELMQIQDPEETRKLWQDDIDLRKLERKIASKHYSPRDMFLWKCLTGNDKLLAVYAKKILRDSLPVELEKQGFGVVVMLPPRNEHHEGTAGL